jgi:hypothetical protein
METASEDQELVVTARGPVSPDDVAYARRKIASLLPLAPGRVLFAKMDLVLHQDPARQRPAFAKAEFDLDRRSVRAHAAATTVLEAVDQLEARLRERLERSVHRPEAMHLRHRGGPHEWRHGDEPTSRPASYPRPDEERQIVRRKSFAVDALTPEDAVLDLEQLDHDFYLFTNLRTGEDNVLHRTGDDRYELIQPSPSAPLDVEGVEVVPSAIRPSSLTVDEAIALLDAAGGPFVFFIEPQTGRGSVVYRRYDGHYGLIVNSAN